MIKLHCGDALAVLQRMPDESVHCVMTSPPYYGLRDYGTARWEGGDAGCDHKRPGPKDESAATPRDGHKGGFRNGTNNTDHAQEPYRSLCRKCGARRIDAQLGLEPTPDEYIARMVAVFREVKRVLRSDGTAWVNMGDNYNSAASNNWTSAKNARRPEERDASPHPRQKLIPGLKPKDMLGMPWRLAFALQADGWWLRSDIIWAKPNPMPESVTDRPTKSHEYLFLLAKSARYYWDAEAVRECGAEPAGKRAPFSKQDGLGGRSIAMGRKPSGNEVPGKTWEYTGHRNLRTVWTIPTQAYKGAHFATFPVKLVTPCVKAGTSERGVCPRCGAGWRRVVEPTEEYAKKLGKGQMYRYVKGGVAGPSILTGSTSNKSTMPEYRTLSWRPSCSCPAHEPVPATVLDPFCGSGTTGAVAKTLGRNFIGIDLSPEYLKLARKRIAAAPTPESSPPSATKTRSTPTPSRRRSRSSIPAVSL